MLYQYWYLAPLATAGGFIKSEIKRWRWKKACEAIDEASGTPVLR